MNDRKLSVIATREEITLHTSFDYPPIPCRNFDWQAIDANTYDGGMPQGFGRTEYEAVSDLCEKIEDRNPSYLERMEAFISTLLGCQPQCLQCGRTMIPNEVYTNGYTDGPAVCHLCKQARNNALEHEAFEDYD